MTCLVLALDEFFLLYHNGTCLFSIGQEIFVLWCPQLKILHLSCDRGADASKTTNSEDIEMKTNLVDKKGDPNYVEEAGP